MNPINTPRIAEIGNAHLLPVTNRVSRLPYWAIVTALLGVLIAWSMASNERYQQIFAAIRDGLVITIFVTVVAYIGAVLIGLIVALGRVSRNKAIQQISTFYVEIIRGVPTLVLLLYVAFVVIPGVITGLNVLGGWLRWSYIPVISNDTIRLVRKVGHPTHYDTGLPLYEVSPIVRVGHILTLPELKQINEIVRVIIALMIAYSAFISEIFRAGIDAVDRGQMEAAQALGMTYWQAMRHVILRQAFRIAVPPLGNDLIAMLKDSSLVSALAVRDITLQAKLFEARTFFTFETYNMLAFLYLTMTLILSLVVKWLENRIAQERRIS